MVSYGTKLTAPPKSKIGKKNKQKTEQLKMTGM